ANAGAPMRERRDLLAYLAATRRERRAPGQRQARARRRVVGLAPRGHEHEHGRAPLARVTQADARAVERRRGEIREPVAQAVALDRVRRLGVGAATRTARGRLRGAQRGVELVVREMADV